MRLPSRAAPAIAGAVLVMAAPAVTPASASTVGVRATGIFFYHSPDSGDVEIEDPDNGECRLLLQGATSADNRTDARATLFLDQLCEEPAGITLDPGENRTFAGPIPHSAMFG
ncbi:hypothetical protein [Actinomadura citrea]|uniref:Uncharacterized protein n=1 Tax=Actinomadura citrea TaxID=46158 RepID=A0A7Y9G6A9_9ACTN|nr:hypothetical protein [Actinomadura citrea]NYE10664.1 hypothetical protein [Actinomadura citrea]GGT74794.1 hypothetical protein GCM10010177_36040 [Actinomadura citrea]